MVTLRHIQEARERIQGSVYVTPIISATYDALNGVPVYLKMENFQRTGSFKERGAANCLLKIKEQPQTFHEVVAASAGNHSQAVSLHGTRLGYKVSIVMPKATPLTKITATESWGGEVTLHGDYFDEALDLAKKQAKEKNAIFVHAYDDEDVIAGQGTLGLEILEQFPKVDSIIVPVGGGGLSSGIATAVKEMKPSCKIYGVQTEACSKVFSAVKKTPFDPKTLAPTIAEGIAVKHLGDLTIPILQKYLDDIVLVSEEKIAEAIMLLLEKSKAVAEGAAAASLAALLQGLIPMTENTLCLVCGGNIDVSLISRVIEKGLLKTHRLLHLEVVVVDRPGGLSGLTGILAKNGANIRQIYHEHAFADLGLTQTGTDLILETRGESHKDEILKALKANGYEFKFRV